MSQEFQSAYTGIHKLGVDLLHYLQELREGKLREGDDTKGLQTVENDIQIALKALTSQKYQVAVIAAMKAGKSTFLNVLIGADILASESEACTVCRTDIKPIDNTQIPRLLEYREAAIVLTSWKSDRALSLAISTRAIGSTISWL